ncbi:TRAP transporter fused permease subunit [Deltaproteobacteria bacterium IMCC39524]|nr:TRAP transporter fused permease subunit [Deltaproteobacteria bacterium IMCC39524]
MAIELQEDLKDLSPAEQEKLKKLMEKDSKSYRSPTGIFKWLVAVLGGGMVLFYFYTAGLAAVGTQYHRGVYVFVTYVLVFLLYPAGTTRMRIPLSLVIGSIISAAIAGLVFFESIDAFHAELVSVNMGLIGAILLGGAVIGASATFIDSSLMKKWPNNPTLSDILYALTAAGVVYYWIHEFEVLNYRAGAETHLDAMISIVGIVLSLEVCRRVLGWSMTFVGLGMFIYGYLGPIFPEIIAHRGFGIERLCTALYLTTNGVFGVMANVLATYVILFIFFGAFLHKSGAGKFFIDFPLALAGRSTGGPAKVAVIASAFFGSVSGSAIANTVSTGAFTIPLMKRAGFRPHVAGAIEPSASIGGMFLPPVMGAGGFLMAELTETSYAYIMMIAIFPALLYFFSVFCMIHFEAKKQGIKGIDDDEFPHWKDVLKKQWYYSLPLIIITILMVIGKSPGMAAFWSALSCIVVSWVRQDREVSFRDRLIFVPVAILFIMIVALGYIELPFQTLFGFKIQFFVTLSATIWCLLVSAFRKDILMDLKGIWEAILTGANNTLIIGATLGVIGIIVGTISLTGIGLKFSDIIISLASGNLLAAIFLVALASLVLGMGVPVTAAYLITAVLAVPPLMEMGVPLLCAHMIVYWFSQDSNITPPVCVAAYAGAAIAGSDPWKTGWTSFKFAKLLYVMPILFAFTPAILFQPHTANVKVPTLADDLPFASVLSVEVREGGTIVAGDTVVRIMVGDEIIDIKAERGGNVTEVKTFAGGMVNPGETIIEAVDPATGWQTISSFWSAFLGTIAFSATTMMFWFRRTTIPEWLLLAVGTLFLYWPTLVSDGIGLVLVGLVIFMQIAKNKKEFGSAIAPS